MKKYEQSLRDLWDTINCTITRIVESQKERRERGRKIFEGMVENFPNLMKDINLISKEAQQTPNMRNLRSIPRHLIIKVLKGNYEETMESSKKEATHHIAGLLNEINS